MAALQTNARSFNPNQLALSCVASYQRRIDATLERVWENVHDWEHLPHLHASSFDYIELDDAGDWGWRTWSSQDHSGHIELCVASEHSYVARGYQGGQQQTEIWTRLKPFGATTDIEVEFHLPDVPEESAARMGELMLALYMQLWDEDEAMMQERQRRLDQRRSDDRETVLGEPRILMNRLASGETVLFELGRREFQLREHQGQLLCHATICPHLLGPLQDADLSQGQLTCPWHGYRFSLDNGACLEPGNAACKLSPAPQLHEEQGLLVARLPESTQ